MDDEQPEPDLPVQQRRAESTDGIDFAVGEQVAHGVGRGVRAGTLDARPPDGAGRGAVRPRPELVSGAAGRAVQIPARAHHHSGNGGRGQLQGHHAQARRGLRRVRRRQDGAQGTPGPIPRRRGYLGHLPQHQSDAADAADDVTVRHVRCHAGLERRERQLRARLRPAEPGRAGPPGEWWRPVRRRVGHQVRAVLC